MNTLWRRYLNPLTLHRTLSCSTVQKTVNAKLLTLQNPNNNFQRSLLKCKNCAVVNSTVRYKSKKRQHDSDDEDETFDDDDKSLSKDSKVVKFSTTSLRTDAILKHALGIARNKIELVFYESKIRVNGEKILKKSHSVRQGDEIDVIKAVSPKNPEHLYVSRVEVINIEAAENSISITARRFKTLLIENYEKDPYKTSHRSEEAN